MNPAAVPTGYAGQSVVKRGSGAGRVLTSSKPRKARIYLG